MSYGGLAYELGVEFGEAGLAGVVEDEDGVDHDRFCKFTLKKLLLTLNLSLNTLSLLE